MENNVNKKVFITGGTAGIGKATTLLLAENGYHIFLIGRDSEKIEDLREDAAKSGLGKKIHCQVLDLDDTKKLKKDLPQIWNDHGPFSVLINNAGIGFGGVRAADFDSLEYLIHTNLGSYLKLSSFFSDKMVTHKIAGDIINVGSMSADTRDAESSGYVATKAGIQGFTEALRKELNPHDIRVSLIEPGAVGTDLQKQSSKEQLELEEKMEMLQAEDIAKIILFVLQQERRTSIVEIKVKPLRQFI